MIRIGPNIVVADEELEETFIRASGPGGQNVNKVSTAVQLRFDVRNAPGLSEPVKRRLERLAGGRLTQHGVLIVTAQQHRSQERNRRAAREMVLTLLQAAAVAPKSRRPTATPYSSRLGRLKDKSDRSRLKRLRGAPSDD